MRHWLNIDMTDHSYDAVIWSKGIWSKWCLVNTSLIRQILKGLGHFIECQFLLILCRPNVCWSNGFWLKETAPLLQTLFQFFPLNCVLSESRMFNSLTISYFFIFFYDSHQKCSSGRVSKIFPTKNSSNQSVQWGALAAKGNTKGGSITVPLTSCLTGLESVVRQLTIFVFICETD